VASPSSSSAVTSTPTTRGRRSSSRRSPLLPSLPHRVLFRVGDDAADDLAVVQVLVARVDVVERVAAGDELVELELAGPVEAEQPGDVVERVAHAEDVTLDAALPADHAAVGGQLDLLLGAAADRGDGHLAALAHDRRGLGHH